jgi:uncharacterized protein (DUF4415 family)
MRKKLKPLTNKAGKVRELTAEDIRAMKPAKEVLPKEFLEAIKRKRGERGPQKQPKKILIAIRYSPEVVQYFKKTGEGWQVRMDQILKRYVKKKASDRAA